MIYSDKVKLTRWDKLLDIFELKLNFTSLFLCCKKEDIWILKDHK